MRRQGAALSSPRAAAPRRDRAPQTEAALFAAARDGGGGGRGTAAAVAASAAVPYLPIDPLFLLPPEAPAASAMETYYVATGAEKGHLPLDIALYKPARLSEGVAVALVESYRGPHRRFESKLMLESILDSNKAATASPVFSGDKWR